MSTIPANPPAADICADSCAYLPPPPRITPEQAVAAYEAIRFGACGMTWVTEFKGRCSLLVALYMAANPDKSRNTFQVEFVEQRVELDREAWIWAKAAFGGNYASDLLSGWESPDETASPRSSQGFRDGQAAALAVGRRFGHQWWRWVCGYLMPRSNDV